MNLREILKEISKYSAIAKDSGKLVYFKSQKAKDAAIKSGTHTDKKSKGSKDSKYSIPAPKSKLGKSDFATDVEKKIKSGPVTITKKVIAKGGVWDYHNEFMIPLLKGIKNTSDYIKLGQQQKAFHDTIMKNKKFSSAIREWQDSATPKSRKLADELLIKNPPTPIQTDRPVLRGMSLRGNNYDKFMKLMMKGKDIKLPPSSFTFQPEIAWEFSNIATQEITRNPKDKPKSIIFKLKSECNKLSAYFLAENQENPSEYTKEYEVFTQSNSKFRVEGIEQLDFKEKGDNLTIINLVQKCDGLNEGEEDVLDLSDSDFMFSLFGPTQKAKE